MSGLWSQSHDAICMYTFCLKEGTADLRFIVVTLKSRKKIILISGGDGPSLIFYASKQ